LELIALKLCATADETEATVNSSTRLIRKEDSQLFFPFSLYLIFLSHRNKLEQPMKAKQQSTLQHV